MKNILFSCFVFGMLAIFACDKSVEPTAKSALTAEMSWQSQLGCFDGVLLGSYYGRIEIRGASKRENLRIFYGDSLSVDTIINPSEIQNFVVVDFRKILRNIRIVSGYDTLDLVSSDSMYGSSDENTYHAFPVNYSIGLGEAKKSVSIIQKDSLFDRIHCSFDNREHIDTIWTKAKSGILEIEIFADSYANEYDIFSRVVDSTGTEYDAGRFYSSFPPIFEKKSSLKRSRIRFSSYLPYLPAVVLFPLDGGFGYRVRIEQRIEQ